MKILQAPLQQLLWTVDSALRFTTQCKPVKLNSADGHQHKVQYHLYERSSSYQRSFILSWTWSNGVQCFNHRDSQVFIKSEYVDTSAQNVFQLDFLKYFPHNLSVPPIKNIKNCIECQHLMIEMQQRMFIPNKYCFSLIMLEMVPCVLQCM